MNRSVTFGVVGGYGATGRVVVSELWKSSDGSILIGGRDLAKGEALASEFDARVSAARVDVLDADSLDDFCSRCSIVVNTAGPVMVLQDRVAQAALRRRCHYIDPAGLLTVKERMLPRNREVEDLGLSFVSSAGLLPGLTEIVPAYADTIARSKMDAIKSLTLYFGDTGVWSENAFQEAAWLLRQRRSQRPGYFRRGEWVNVSVLKASRKVNLAGRIGQHRFFLFCIPELGEIGPRFTGCVLSAYAYLPSLRAAVTGALVAWLPLPLGLSARLLRDALRRHRLPVGGFVVVECVGCSQGREFALKVEIIYEQHREYWINGLVPATVARMISEGKSVHPGVNFLADAVDPVSFIAELCKGGVHLSENLEPREGAKSEVNERSVLQNQGQPQHSKRDVIYYLLAALCGTGTGWADVAINDLLFTALLVLASCMMLGLLRPRRPWRWVLMVSVFIPLTELAAYEIQTIKPSRGQVYGSFLAILPGIAGAYGGSMMRGVIDNLTEKK